MSFLAQFVSLSPYLVATLIASMVALLLLTGHRRVPGRGAFGWLMAVVALWSTLNFFEDASTHWPSKLLFANLQYLCIGAVPMLFLRFAVQIGQRSTSSKTASPRFWGLLAILPAVTAAAVWFDAGWGLVRQDLRPVTVDGLTVVAKVYGPLFWAFLVYSYAVVGTGFFLWFRFLLNRQGFRNPGSLLPFLAAWLPWISNALMAWGLNPWPGHDPTPPAFALFGLITLGSLHSNRVLSLLPVAGEAVVDTWPSPLLVLDHDSRLVYFNDPAARRWNLTPDHRGRSSSWVLPWLPPHPASGRLEPTTVSDPGSQTVWEVIDRPLEILGRSRGWVLVLHDVSALQARISERTLALEAAYARLSDELVHRRRTEEQLFYYSLHDPLTGLANRSLFLSRLDQALGKLRRHPEAGFGLLLLNLSGFKKINDLHGHAAGDQFLAQSAQRLREALRSSDTAARSGSDTFLILLDAIPNAEALREAADRIRSQVEGPLDVKGLALLPSLRVAMVLADPGVPGPETLLADGEQALDRTREDPSGAPVLFDPQWRELRHARFLLKDDLAKALVQGDLGLVFQPIVSLTTGQVQGFETLARWNHPHLGAVPPSQFIAMAEHEGIIQPLGLWVLRETARFFAGLSDRMADTSHLFLSVNVSPRQLAEPDFASIVLGLLDRERFAPQRLHLEITETALVEHTETLVPILADLRREGIRIKLDDFGTGYSSLHTLHRLPLDTLKIDRSFITELPHGRPIIRTILRLAEDLQLDVVAEGVETALQRDWLTDLGCAAGQGYLFAPGLSAQAVEDRLQFGVTGFLDPHSAPA